MKKKTKRICQIVGGVTVLAIIAGLGYVQFHKPDLVTNPCFRSCHRDDGVPKKAFDTPQKANWQVIKQFLLHGEICNSYQVGDKYYTGHSKNAICRNINPFKS